MPAYWVEHTNELVPDTPPALITRIRWRAERQRDRLNNRTYDVVGSYRWEVIKTSHGRYMVVAMVNKLHRSKTRYG